MFHGTPCYVQVYPDIPRYSPSRAAVPWACDRCSTVLPVTCRCTPIFHGTPCHVQLCPGLVTDVPQCSPSRAGVPRYSTVLPVTCSCTLG
ncbi:hypothetical protein NDU88_008972 [Pleurodeles waltl]|uniref:Uncharacterized protein n=1 Tax=Pleurodeles waltl TaxID=8319 RepID=A0AAV7N9Z7_PLEWA|nr:hypothetical protein NDU88_008972 [Pleurodeles waltl]